MDRKRFITFEGTNRVTLRVEPSEIPGAAISTLVWDRVNPTQ
jgi:hypothetical protein